MGFGLFLSFLSVLVTAVVEVVRRSIAIKEGYSDDPQGLIPMSAMWLLPQNSLTGFAEALHAIGQNEFYISEFPRSMSSVAAALLGVVELMVPAKKRRYSKLGICGNKSLIFDLVDGNIGREIGHNSHLTGS
ncbi:hypothetical protein K7X08_013866 [Anisodus acutangulus]|uniref:Uncharacterized protein n=1 Tax=Anisodus acutangulus TaxID=402998 RepID=A0A9Q1LPL1_9SOLA|nr:hypothetical protein K7X08_013866 [Anisodus acutangulus]